jgi:flagellum-specific ATP synthase
MRGNVSPSPSPSISPPNGRRWAPFVQAVRNAELIPRIGRVTGYRGLVVESEGPDVVLGECCDIDSALSPLPIRAEVVGFHDQRVLLMPYDDIRGIRTGSEVLATGLTPSIAVDESMLGRVLDAFGRPLDGKTPVAGSARASLRGVPPNPVSRERIRDVFETGIHAIDACLPIGRGQRVGIFAGSGVGKSSLLGMIARNSSADVNVIALVGERGREVRDFIEEHLNQSMSRTVLIVSTADESALRRKYAAFSAMAIAEYFRDQGRSVALILDSLTRVAMAQREIGLSSGEPPTSRGYTPSVFSLLPSLLERSGTGIEGSGSITGIFTILVEGDDFNEPVSDHARAVLDGHIVLTRELAQHGRFPAIDILQSASRLARQVATPAETALASDAINLMSVFERSRDMLDFGAYKPGANPELDRAVACAPKLIEFFKQDFAASQARATSVHRLKELLS